MLRSVACLLLTLAVTSPALAGVDVELRVTDPKGKSVRGAEVTVFERWERGERTVEKRISDSKGLARFSEIDETKLYRLEVTPPSNRHDLALSDEGKWTPRSGEVRLKPGFTIRGRVKDPLGRSLERVYVYRWAPVQFADGSFTTGGGSVVEPDGSFRFDHVPRDRAVLRAFRQDASFNDHDAVVVSVEPDRPEVLIVLARDDESAMIRRRVEGIRGSRPAYLIEPSATRVLKIPGLEELPLGTVLMRIPNVQFNEHGEFLIPPTFEAVLGMLWVPPETPDDDLSLHVPDVGLTPQETPLRLAPGESIRGRVRPSSSLDRPEVFAIGPGAHELPASVKEDGSFVVRGLPKGRWRVKTLVKGPDARILHGSVEADTGSEVVIEAR